MKKYRIITQMSCAITGRKTLARVKQECLGLASVDARASHSSTLSFPDYWIGAVSNARENPANGYGGGRADANTDVGIQCMYHSPLISSHASCRTLILMNRQTLQGTPGFKLTVTREND